MRPLVVLALLAAACGPADISQAGGGGGDGGSSGSADARPSIGADAGPCRASCPGCCIGDVCFLGDNNAACGKPGQLCTQCPTGSTCIDQSCGAPTDPCNGVPTSGRCASSTSVEMCVQPTGTAEPEVQTIDCRSGETCQVVDGIAKCALSGTCVDGTTECTNMTTLRTCQGGNWVTSSCANGCVDSALGDSCAAAAGLVTINGVVEYQARGTNDDRTD
jgi:hypothetical protein